MHLTDEESEIINKLRIEKRSAVEAKKKASLPKCDACDAIRGKGRYVYDAKVFGLCSYCSPKIKRDWSQREILRPSYVKVLEPFAKRLGLI